MRIPTLAIVSLLLGVAVACSSSGSSSTDAACSSLGSCCATASAASQSGCFQIYSGGNPTACAEELVTLQTAGACGSVSPGSGAGTGCTGLATCCAEMTEADAVSCTSIVSLGVAATCTAELTVYESANACHATGPGSGTGVSPGSGTGTGHGGSSGTGTGHGGSSGTGTGHGSSSGTGSGHGSSSGTGSGSGTSPMDATAPVDCAPHALPAGYTPRTIGTPGGSCTSVQDEGISTCLNGGTSCSAYDVGSCETCAFTDLASSSWGPFVYVTAAGAGQVVIPFYDFAGCLLKVDPIGGAACAKALSQTIQCELEACLAYCPIASATDTTGTEALLGTSTSAGCLGDADSTTCAQYADAESAACTPLTTDSGTGPLDKCNALVAASDLGPYVALFCGGEDAGI